MLNARENVGNKCVIMLENKRREATKVYQTETHLSCFRFSLFLSLHSLINTLIPLTSHKQLSKAEKERKESKKERKVGRFFTAELVVLIPLGKSKLILILILNFDFQKQSKDGR